MSSRKTALAGLLVCLVLVPTSALRAEAVETSVQINQEEVDRWNNFANSLLTVHRTLNTSATTKIVKRTGAYGGEYARDYRFVEEDYVDSNTKQLLSRVRWHNKKKRLFHTIEVFVYDANNKLIRDYTAAYLPYDRNAPYQTLINFHSYNDGLHAYRQFDASGDRLFEKCEGKRWGGDVLLLLEDYEMPVTPFDYSGTYLACFSDLPLSAGPYLNPLIEVKTRTAQQLDPAAESPAAAGDFHETITYYSNILISQPNNMTAYTKRAYAYLMVYEFEKSIADYSMAIKLDPGFDQAYFGRGMAYGRNQQFELAIADLSEFIRRNPASSRAYTKRGVRYIWMGKLKLAKSDLSKAIDLDPGNAEANDDIGVLYAQEKRYAKALGHFQASIKNDPTYQKAYHNLALTYYLTNESTLALQYVDKALELNPASKNSTLLKAEILESQGFKSEAKKLTSDAQMMNEPNWSEVMTPGINQ